MSRTRGHRSYPRRIRGRQTVSLRRRRDDRRWHGRRFAWRDDDFSITLPDGKTI